MSDKPATLAEALAILQTRLPHIVKDSKADIPNRPPHAYAGLGNLSHELLPTMGELGLSFSAKPTVRKGQFGMRYKLRLAGTSEVDKGFWPLPGGTPQATGSALTYYRRYILQCLTGAVADDDDDGAAAAQQQEKQAPKPRTRGKTTMTAGQRADHDALRDGAAEGRVNGATRTRSPDEADPWQDQPAGEFTPPETSLPSRATRPASRAQLIAAHWKRLGIIDDDERHNWTARMAGVEPIASTNDLDDAQQKEVLSALSHCKDLGGVQAWIDRKAGAK